MKDAEVILDINPDVEPVVQPPCKIPQAMVEPLKREIDRMLELGVIRKLDINEAMDWVHNLVLVRKPNGKLRVCLDPRTINKALRFNVHNSHTFQDISSSIRGVKKISKIDANSDFWTLLMSQESQLLTTFNTPWGRFCFMKMPFGLNQAQYFFQYYMDMNFCDINPTTNIIADDAMIHGNTDEEHDCNLIQILNKCREIGLKLNPDKCEFGKSEVTFYGNIVSDQGFKPDPCKVDAIVRMPAPTDKTELSSFLGMVNYLAPYIPKLSDCTAVLRQLNKKNADFTWNIAYVQEYVHCIFFDPDKDIVIECDASGIGIGGTLLQDGHPVTFISQALTSTQQHYSNIECELLALVVVIEHLHHYVFERKFTMHTDHSPLANIFKRCLNDTSPRLQCLLLRLSQYEMEVQYVTQKHVPIADCLSRLVVDDTAVEDESLNLQIVGLGVENMRIDSENIR